MRELFNCVLILVFFFLNVSLANSFEISQKNLIKPYCDGKINFNSTYIHTKLTKPKKIEIIFNNQRKYYKNFFRLTKLLGNYKDGKKIPKKMKKFMLAKIYAHYDNGIVCEFNAKARIAGSKGLHILNNKFASSMKVKIIDGNISHKSDFKLIAPRARLGKNEIFLTTLFEEMDILVPLTFFVETEVNGNKVGKFIFQETISQSIISHNRRNKGIILKANKRSQFINSVNNYNKDKSPQFNLGIIDGNDTFSNQIKINAIDKLNYSILQNYNNRDLYIASKKSNFFEVIMIATGANHGLSREDRRFYYDFLNDSLEPIYYDGKSNIYTNNVNVGINSNNFLENHIQAAKEVKEILDKINIENFINKLELNGLKTDTKKVEILFKNIISNLDTISKSKKKTIQKNFSSKYFVEHKDNNNFNFKIAFGGINNFFTICELDLSNCKLKKVSINQAQKIFENQVTNIDKKKIIYLRATLEDFKNNISPKNGVNKMKKNFINSNLVIFNNDKISLKIDRLNKIVDFYMIDNSGRAIVQSDKITDWNFNLYGFNNIFNYKDTGYYYTQPNSCVTFLNSSFKKISLLAMNTECPNTFQFTESKGTIKNVRINNSKYDAFDADFSNLTIKNIEVDYAGQECIGLKTGNYKIINAKLNNCRDKAVSSGELSNLLIDKINIMNSHFGLAAKDSSKIVAKNVVIKNSDLCLFAYRSKYEYQSSLIVTNKNKFHCDNKASFVQKGSLWNSLLENEILIKYNDF